MALWVRLVALVAALKSAAAIVLVLTPGALSSPARPLVYSVQQFAVLIVAFSATGLVLILARTRDMRAVWLGCILLVTATPFADSIFLFSATPLAVRVSGLLAPFQMSATVPLFFWLFLARFPQPPAPDTPTVWTAAAGFLTRVSLVVAIVLVASNLSELFWPIQSLSNGDLRRLVSRQVPGPVYYWPPVIAAAVPALVFLFWKARTAPAADRRRIGVFTAGLLLGFAPVSIEVMLEAVSPAYARLVESSAAQALIATVIFLSLAVVPLVTAYSVMVDRVVEIRLVIRSALQYALAKYTLLAIIAIPLIGLGWYLYVRRDQTVVDLLQGSGALALVSAIIAAALAYRIRRRALTALDRRFFREHYDARQILVGLAERCGSAATIDGLLSLVAAEIDRALHLDSVTILVATSDGAALRSADGRIRPLNAASSLASLVGGDTSPLFVDLERQDSALRRLPEEERNWLADAAFALLVPLKAADGALLGLIGLGPKRSEVPFSQEDRLLLEAIASPVALRIENRRLRETPGPMDASRQPPAPRLVDDGRPAGECLVCGRVYPPDATTCDCGRELSESPVPYVLAGKFQFDRRLGRGGMGVVYRALDVDLGRQVAIKTLPHTRPEDAVRLRREAKAMASVQHENLAFIFGAETWRGTPMLVVELLTEGTLSAKLRRAPIPPAQAVDIAVALARGVEHLHEAGIIHGDIKPSNIGFTRSDVPKLLDFGVARILRERLPSVETTTRTWSGRVALGAGTMQWPTDTHVAGTPLYMSPEALDGESARPAFDVWSLTVVLFEMIAGAPPFRGSSMIAIREAMRSPDGRDVRAFCPGCPARIAEFLQDALSSRPSDRPRTASQLRASLSGLRDAAHPG
jgi:hypothetical protein